MEQPTVAPAAPQPTIRWSDELWGKGVLLPGGVKEASRLAALLPLNPDARLLLAGRDAGGVAAAIAEARRCPISAFLEEGDASPEALLVIRSQAKRIRLLPWDPASPSFQGRQHHALLLEPLRRGATPRALLNAVATSLLPNGQLVLLELVAEGAADPVMSRWLQLEGCAMPPREQEIAAALAQAGFTVHVTEDLADRHAQAVRAAWVAVTERLASTSPRPPLVDMRRLVDEAELWLLRLRLLEKGALRMRRWHATLLARPGA